MGHGASGAQSSRRSVGVEMRLGGEVSSSGGSQVWMDCAMAGAVVWEGIRRLGDRRSDVGLLSPVAPCAIGYDVLLGLQKGKQRSSHGKVSSQTVPLL